MQLQSYLSSCVSRTLTFGTLHGLSSVRCYQELSSHWLLSACLFFKHDLDIFFGLSFSSHLTKGAGGWLPVYLRSFFNFFIQDPLCSNACGNTSRSPAVSCPLLIIFPRQLASLSFIRPHSSVLLCLLLNPYALWARSCLLQNFVKRDS